MFQKSQIHAVHYVKIDGSCIGKAFRSYILTSFLKRYQLMKVAIVQSNYIPWKGYFDLIAKADVFILFDDMQYTRRDWRNRNLIKTPNGTKWLTVPVKVKGKYFQKIKDTEIDGVDWINAHWKSLYLNYRKSPHFIEIANWLEPLYQKHFTSLSELNRCFIEEICAYLGITTDIKNSWDYSMIEGKSERLANLCAQAGATEYISGPSAMAYLDEKEFLNKGVKVTWFDNFNYPEYPQLWGAFDHKVSILDLLFNCGKESSTFMRYVS